jgi:hypothetical protein
VQWFPYVYHRFFVFFWILGTFFIIQSHTGLRFFLERALWLTFKGSQHCFKTFSWHLQHFQPFYTWQKYKLILHLTQPLQNLPDKEIQLNSTGIRSELKGWMSHDALQHVCTCHNMTHQCNIRPLTEKIMSSHNFHVPTWYFPKTHWNDLKVLWERTCINLVTYCFINEGQRAKVNVKCICALKYYEWHTKLKPYLRAFNWYKNELWDQS